jgi:hypothetical protein
MIIMFYGAECPHCHVMMPLVDRLIKESGSQIEKLEVWHNATNADKLRKFETIIREAADGEFGVPAFLDETNKRALVGETSYEELKKWVLNKK